MAKIKLGYLENHAMSLFVYLLNRKNPDFEEKPIKVKLKKPLKNQIKKQLSKLEKDKLDFFYLITSLEGIIQWKEELFQGVSQNLYFMVTPDHIKELRSNNQIQGINYNKNTTVHFLSKSNLCIQEGSLHKFFIAHLLHPECASNFDYLMCNYCMQEEEFRKTIMNISNYARDEELESLAKFAAKASYALGIRNNRELKNSELKSRVKESKAEFVENRLKPHEKGREYLTFGATSYVIRNSINQIFDPIIRKNLESFIDQTEIIFSKKLKYGVKDLRK